MRINKTIILVLFFVTTYSFSQQSEGNLFSIDGKQTSVNEFVNVYTKNLDVVADESQKDVENYLDMYINYKLKINQAYELRLDTVSSYKKELKHYRKQLVLPFLKDKNTSEKLVLEAYERTKYEVNASHILVQIKPKPSPADTLKAYTKINAALNKINSGTPFSNVAKEFSEDPSVKENGGNLGYFSAFQMVYPFENAAYSTKKNEVSKPFKTRFGYHIVKVNAIRESKGEVEVGHIMIKNASKNAKQIIDSVYQELLNGKDFELLAKELSEDKASAVNGGKLPKFGSGRMLPAFEEQAFLLNTVNDFSKPFKTDFGWHIVKLFKKYPVAPYVDMKEILVSKINKNERSYVANKNLNIKLRSTLKNKTLITSFDNLKDSNDLSKSVLEIENTTIDLAQFLNYLKQYNKPSNKKSFNEFKDIQLLEYYKDNLENYNSDFKGMMNEYKEGLLLFDLLQSKIWKKSEKDTVGLKNYFDSNKSKYINDPKSDFESVKGKVINDYQQYLDSLWVAGLRSKYKININNKALKKIIKQFN